jgi:hypothetical protein
MSNEIFINCCINPQLYDATSTGKILNKKTGRILNGATSKEGYIRINLKNEDNEYKKYTLQRIIYKSFYPEIDINNKDIDHINRNKKDNNLNNLRPATRQQNGANQKTRKNSITQLKNITTYKLKDGTIKYKVEILKSPLRIRAYFTTEADAIIFRNNKILELWGGFGYNGE